MICDYFENYDLDNIVTPINVTLLEQLLVKSNYDKEETKFLVEGFTEGFKINYCGKEDQQDYAKNIPFRSVGSLKEFWEKLMKEVRLKRYAGPFQKIPFTKFALSPIGLVPKAGEKTRLIFHLSYQFQSGNEFINASTPAEDCSVKYKDLDEAVCLCCELLAAEGEEMTIFFSKSDLSSAFRLIPLFPGEYRWLVMMAKHPVMDETFYFIDKCLPFGHSISCSHFQHFSNALKHILEWKTGKNWIVNYLDDFLFIATTKEDCDWLMDEFLELCDQLGVPVAMEKTEWGSGQMVFL